MNIFKKPYNNLSLLIFFSLLFIILFLVYNRLFWTIPHYSDDANLLLEAKDLLNGNILLKGWALPPDSWWTVDIPIAAATIIVRGFSSSLMSNIPALIYSAIITLSTILVYKKNKSNKTASLATFSILAIPSSYLVSNIISHSPIRLGATAYFLIVLFLLERLITFPKKNKVSLFFFFLLMVLLTIGDPFTIYIITLPAIVVFCYNYISTKSKEGNNLLILLLLLTSIAIAEIVIHLVKSLGGFYTSSYSPSLYFAEFNNISTNIGLTIQGTLDLFGANFFGLPILSKISIEALIRNAPLLLLLIVTIKLVKEWLNKKKTIDIISELLLAIIIFDIGAYILGSRTVDIGTTRYLIPVFVYGSILIGRNWNRIYKNKLIEIGTLIILVLPILFFIPKLYAPIVPSTTSQLESWLIEHHYAYGYAGYWEASIITVDTRGKVKVRQVIGPSNKIVPMNWLSNKSWYMDEGEAKKANFIIINNDPTSVGQAGANVTKQSIINTFGSPLSINIIGNYTVYTWNKDITKNL